jgi:hypothetical protein
LRRIATDLTAALAAEDSADLGEQQPHIVGHFGGRADGRAAGTAGGAARHGDGGRQTVDPLGLGLFQAIEELPRVGGEALDVPPLAFGVKRIERQAGLAAAAEPAEDNQLSAGDVEIDRLEVVDCHTPQRNLSRGAQSIAPVVSCPEISPVTYFRDDATRRTAIGAIRATDGIGTVDGR